LEPELALGAACPIANTVVVTAILKTTVKRIGVPVISGPSDE
jgi:hypothetical protein